MFDHLHLDFPFQIPESKFAGVTVMTTVYLFALDCATFLFMHGFIYLYNQRPNLILRIVIESRWIGFRLLNTFHIFTNSHFIFQSFRDALDGLRISYRFGLKILKNSHRVCPNDAFLRRWIALVALFFSIHPGTFNRSKLISGKAQCHSDVTTPDLCRWMNECQRLDFIFRF